MKQPKTKGGKVLLAVLIAALLIGACFTSVALYAKKELSKPKFTLPEIPPEPSASALPEDAESAAAYVLRLFDEAVSADDAEGRWHTEVKTEGAWTTPFADADARLLQLVGARAAEQIASLYPHTDEYTPMPQTTDVPILPLRAGNVLSYTAEQGRMNDAENTEDEDCYFITLSVDPAAVDTNAMRNGDIFRSVTQTLSDAAIIEDAAITAQSAELSCRIDRVKDQLLSVRITRTFSVQASIRLQGVYTALLDTPQAEVTLPFTDVQTIEFRHYGVHFTERAMAVNPGDRKALPADVTVNAAVKPDDYKVTFTSDVPDAVTFDDDGVMTVLRLCDTPLTVTMTLRYDGHTYTDSLTVYITDWEVAQSV